MNKRQAKKMFSKEEVVGEHRLGDDKIIFCVKSIWRVKYFYRGCHENSTTSSNNTLSMLSDSDSRSKQDISSEYGVENQRYRLPRDCSGSSWQWVQRKS